MWNKNEPSRNIWRTRDVAEMAAAIKTAPIFIDEVKSNFYNFAELLVSFKLIEIVLIIKAHIYHFRCKKKLNKDEIMPSNEKRNFVKILTYNRQSFTNMIDEHYRSQNIILS
jgi:uncharacterized membrane protein